MKNNKSQTQEPSAAKRWFLAFLAFLLALSPHMAAAVPASREGEFADYGIMFYDPDDNDTVGGMSCGTRGTSGSNTLVGNSTVQQIANFFIAQGFTPAQAAGIIGNAQQESGLWPLRWSNGSGYWGLFQWDIGGREAGLKQKMIDAGYAAYTSEHRGAYGSANSEASQAIPPDVLADILRIQLEHAMSETRTFDGVGWVEQVKSTSSPEEAAEAFLVIFEGAVATTDAAKTRERNRIDFWQPAAGRYYQETAERREHALEAVGQASGTCGLVAGGMTSVSEAQAWLDATGYNDFTNDIHSVYQLPGYNAASWCGFPGPKGSRTNCVGFSSYFIRAHTSLAEAHFTLGQSPGNGIKVVSNLLAVAPNIAYGTQPQPYSVFSQTSGSPEGHTGVVMGVDEERQIMVTIEAACNMSGGISTGAAVRERTFSHMASRNTEYAYLMPFVNGGG